MAMAIPFFVFDNKPDVGPVQPDRPNYTNSAHIAPLDHPYLEFGIRQSKSDHLTFTDYGDGATLRVALKDNFEARIGIPSYLSLHGDGANLKGLGDSSLGFKWRLTPEVAPKKTAVAISGIAIAPTGSSDFRESQWQGQGTLIGSIGISESTELDIDLSLGRLADDLGTYAQATGSASVSRDVGKGFGTFVEFITSRPQVGRLDATSYGDFGFTKLVNPQLQVDCIFGQGFNGIRNDYFVGFGAGVRF
jgi:Putative MetA-pathway of phenol degradation